MYKSYFKNIYRTIFSSFGRYFALVCIVMIGVVFYVGLKVSTTDMLETADEFYEDHNFYDFMLVSSVGFDKSSVDELAHDEKILNAEGAFYKDVIVHDDKEDLVARIHTITSKINTLQLVEGHMPSNENECLVDSRYYDSKILDSVITVTDNNSEETLDIIPKKELKVVGIVDSPIYLSYQRGTTNVGNGSIGCFIFVDEAFFDVDYYGQIFLDVVDGKRIYSDDYNSMINELEEHANELASKLSKPRFERLNEDFNNLKLMLNAQYEAGLITELPEEYYTELNYNTMALLREDNNGYATYKDNADIVKSIALIFPIFFVLVAALVCVTTMSRMVEEERTQIGVFKALGYSKLRILFKYISYSFSATLVGSILGFYIGSFLFPTMIWKAYMTMYTYTSQLKIVHDYSLLFVSLGAATVVIVGTTILTCINVLKCTPANMIRPKAPKAGKRVLVERIGWLWKRLPFLHKVSLRNCFRYKKRFFMMLIGVAGCTALLIIGYGIRDSICDICDMQYEEINVYDYEVSLSDSLTSDDYSVLDTELSEWLESYTLVSRNPIDINFKGFKKSITAVATDDFNKLNEFIVMKSSKDYSTLSKDECILTSNLAGLIKAEVGDKITIKFDNLSEKEYVIGAIYKNYVGNSIVLSEEAFIAGAKEKPYYNCVYGNSDGSFDAYEGVTHLSNIQNVANVSATLIFREYFDEMVKSLNVIVYLVIMCAAVLAFVVMYNLNNINIMERLREIATIKVLGFYRNETSQYVFRENVILTVLGIICGIPLGHFMHGLVMDKIRIEIVSFDIHVNFMSYIYSALITILFAVIVDVFMRRKINKINMSESIKSIE